MKNSAFTIVSAATLAAITLPHSSLLAGDWPQWRGPDYDGISKETGWDPAALKQLKVVWKADVGAGYSAVAVSNGKVYTAGNFKKKTDGISCLDEKTGKEIWRHEYPEPLAPKYYSGGCSATPTVDQGKIHFVSKSGKIFCLDAETGKVLWQKEFGLTAPTWGFSSSAVIHGKAAIYNAGKSGVAYDKSTGAILWSSEDDACGYATPVPFQQQGKTRLAIFAKDTITAVSPDDGKVIWTYPWQTQHDINAADPIISGSQVFISSGYGHGASLIDFSASEPKKVWENKNMRAHMSGPVLINGYLYGFDDNRLTCLDWKTGEAKWDEKSPKKGALMAAGDKLIVLGEDGRLAIAEATPAAYKEISAAQVVDGRCWTMPVLANGRIFVRDSDGHLVCVDVSK